jgi:hypothetical protein
VERWKGGYDGDVRDNSDESTRSVDLIIHSH